MNKLMLSELNRWDGKSSEDLTQLYNQHADRADFVPELLTLLTHNSQYQHSALWLIKHYLESGQSLQTSQCLQLLASGPNLSCWQAKLELLQAMQYLDLAHLPPVEQDKLEYFIRHAISNENKFVRAWAYNAFHLLAGVFPQYKDEALQFLNMALRDEAPSVKARIRQILKAKQ